MNKCGDTCALRAQDTHTSTHTPRQTDTNTHTTHTKTKTESKTSSSWVRRVDRCTRSSYSIYDIATRTTHRHRARRSTRRSHHKKSKCELNSAYYDPPEVNVVCTKFQRVELEVEVEESAIESAKHDTNTRTDSVKTYTAHAQVERERRRARLHTHTQTHTLYRCTCLQFAGKLVTPHCKCVCAGCVCVCGMYLFVGDARHAKLITNFHILNSYGVNKLLW